MKIKIINTQPVTLAQYAESHGFLLLVEQRDKKDFTARFEHLEVKETLDDAILMSSYGTGETAKQAMTDYARQISGKVLVANAYNKVLRATYCVPELKY